MPQASMPVVNASGIVSLMVPGGKGSSLSFAQPFVDMDSKVITIVLKSCLGFDKGVGYKLLCVIAQPCIQIKQETIACNCH